MKTSFLNVKGFIALLFALCLGFGPDTTLAHASSAYISGGTWVVDGQKFFPRGVYIVYIAYTTDADLARIKAAGYNTVVCYGQIAGRGNVITNDYATHKNFLDRANNAGLKVIFSLKDLNDASGYFPYYLGRSSSDLINEAVSNYKGHPTLIGWYIDDELGATQASSIQRIHDQVVGLDPNHPCVSIENVDITPVLNASEALGYDNYPIPNGRLSQTGEYTSLAVSQVHGSKSVVMGVQLSGNDVYDGNSANRAPTLTELRCMSYLTLAAGTNGLLYFDYDFLGLTDAYNPNSFDQSRFNSLWPSSQTTQGELASLDPILLNGTPSGVAVQNATNTRFRAVDYNGKTTVLLANGGNATESVFIPGNFSDVSVRSGGFNPVIGLGGVSVDVGPLASGAIDLTAGSTATNLVVNPSFDAENYDTRTPSGWTQQQWDTNWSPVVPATATYTETSGGSHMGARHGTHWSSQGYTAYTSQTLTNLPNGLYTLRCYARSSGGQTYCYMEAKDYGSSSVTRNIPVSNNYEEVDLPNINVTNGQCTIGIYSQAGAGQWCNFDDFELSGQCLTGTYYDNIDFTGTTKKRLDPTINFNWGVGSPVAGIAPTTFSVRWKGYVVPRYSQAYTFATNTDDGVRLWINGVRVIDHWGIQGATQYTSTPVNLTAGRKASIVMEYFQNTGNASATLSWQSASQVKEIIPDKRTLPDDGKVAGGSAAVAAKVSAPSASTS